MIERATGVTYFVFPPFYTIYIRVCLTILLQIMRYLRVRQRIGVEKYICLLGSDRTPQQNQSFERFKRLTHMDGSLGKILDPLGDLPLPAFPLKS